MSQMGNKRGYKGPQQRELVRLSDHLGRTKGEQMSNGDGPRGIMGHKNADQRDSGVTMEWTRRIRSTQAWS